MESAFADSALQEFERHLLANSERVDQRAVEHYAEAVRALANVLPPTSIEELQTTIDTRSWLPSLRNPSILWDIYSDSDRNIVDSSRLAGLNDLAVLGVPPGLPKEAFDIAVGAAMRALPVIRNLDDFLTESRRFGEVRQFLERTAPDVGDPSAAGQVLIRWLRCFLRDRYVYSRPGYSEILSRVATDSE
jgi:hypothetical protein